jgi:HlyD family secretion protein
MINNYGAIILVIAAGCQTAAGAGKHGEYQGIVELDEVTLAFDVPGRIETLTLEEGALVAAGAEVATLDDALARTARDARAAEVKAGEADLTLLKAGSRREDIRATEALVSAADTALKTAERNVQRVKDMRAQGAATDAQLDDAQAALEQTRGERRRLGEQLTAQRRGARPEELAAAEARIEVARRALDGEETRLAHYHLKAPRAGLVLDRLVEAGEVVAAGTPIAIIADPTRPFVDVFVPESALAGLEPGVRATVSTDSAPQPIAGKIESIGRTTEFTPRFLFSPRERVLLVVRVKVRIEDPQAQLTAGVPAFVAFER